MLTERSGRLPDLRDYRLAVGNPADIVQSPEQAVAKIRQPLRPKARAADDHQGASLKLFSLNLFRLSLH
jgi:hypothetical protein